MKKKTNKIINGCRLAVILSLTIACGNVLLNSYGQTLADYMNTSSKKGSSSDSSSGEYSVDACLKEGREIVTQLESEGAVLLRNENNTLPLVKGSKVTILGAQSYNYVNGGTGSAGGKYDEHTYTMKEAFDGSKVDGDSASHEKYLDVNEKAWNWLETAVGGGRNADTTGEYVGHKGDGTEATFSGSDYKNNKDNYGNGDWGGFKRVCEFSQKVYENHYENDIKADGYNDTVIVTFARSGAEGASPVMDYDGDGKASTGTTYLQLSQDEKDLLKFCKDKYSKTIVLINSSAVMELGEIEQEEYGVDACLWIGHPGEAGLVGVAQILTGEVSPSGRLVDTYPYDHSTMPSFYNNDDNKYTNVENIQSGYGNSSNFGYYQYEEGIYVGYRYYETADAMGFFDSNYFTSHEWKNGKAKGYGEVVQYPFGYGLSYTTFKEEVIKSDISLKDHGTNSITVKVTNTGNVASKQVVQLYMEAPYNQDSTMGIKGVGLQKSSKVLIGFKKTQEIKPGESQEVTISFDTDDLASFDNYGHGCYVLEKGEYSFHIGTDAHNDATEAVKANLKDSYIYDENGVGKRNSDKTVAKVTMSDVDYGDGNMLDGYLSRSDFETGMKTIMKHESSCKEEALFESGVKALGCGALETVDYTYYTYENGEKVQKTIKKYIGGSSYQSYSTEVNWEGLTQDDDRYFFDDANEEHVIDYGAVYYLEVDSNGNAKKDEYGNYIVTTEVTSMRLDVNCPVLKEASYDDEIWAYLVDQTTLEEQITVQGGLGWQTPEVKSVNKSRIAVVDGPGEAGNGNNSYTASTWFTSAVVNASTWNPALVEKMGEAYAHQSKKNGLGGAYCPAMNTHRTPYGGRNFEYFSEDGFIGGKIGAAEVTGLQNEGIVVFIKHMAFNDNDTNRDGNITWFSEQAAREIYLKDYEIACEEVFVMNDDGTDGEFVKGEGALGIMGSLNRDGISWSHQGLYKNILRGEWGFNGLIITDGVGPYPWLMTPGAGLFGGIEGQLGGSEITAYYKQEGNASTTNYGAYLLRQTTKHMLYQNCHAAQVASTQDTSWRTWQVVFNIVLSLGLAASVGFLIVVPAIKKDPEKTAERKEEK